MKPLRNASALVLAALALTACGESTTTVEIADLAGSWSATQFEYEDQSVPGFSVDAISDAGGTLNVTVQESGAFSGDLRIPGLTVDGMGQTITVPVGGTFSINGSTLSVDFDAATEALGLLVDFDASFDLNGDVLTFTTEDADFDFPDAIEELAGIGARGEVPATLTVRLVR
jgi:hypothetical protein